MRKRSRRQIINRIAETIGLIVVALNLVAYYLVYTPLTLRVRSESRRHGEMRQAARDIEARVELLKKFQEEIPGTSKALQTFMDDRTPQRREAYSVADHLVHKVGKDAGVKVVTIAFRLDPDRHDPLERLALEINVEGTYAGLLKFSHELETAQEFLLVRQFSFGPGNDEPISLKMGADLYLTP